MSYLIKAQIADLKPTLDKLAGLKASVQRKVLRKIIRAGVKLVNKAAKARAPVRVSAPANVTPMKLLKKSIGQKVYVHPKSKAVIGVVGPRFDYRRQIGQVSRGPRKGQPIYEDPVNIAHLVERGHKKGKGKGSAAGKFFMQQALDATASQFSALAADIAAAELAKLGAA